MQDQNKLIRVGIIGAGKIVSNLHLPIIKNIDYIKVEFIADIVPNHHLSKLYNTRFIEIEDDLSILPDCDFILLAIPVGTRDKYIVEFSNRGIPVYSEKPFAPDFQTHEKWLKTHKSLSCNYMRRMFSPTVQIKQILESCVFGELEKIKIYEGGIIGGTNKPQNHYQNNPNLSGGGILVERGSHTFSQIDYWFKNIQLKCLKSKVVLQDGLDVDVKAKIQVGNPINSILSFHISLVEPIPNETQFFFEDAIISFNHTDASSKLKVESKKNDKEVFTFEPNLNWATTINQGHYLNFINFLENIKEKAAIDTEYETSLLTTKIIQEIYKLSGE
jgi:predicted dehydrogenase